MLLGIQLELLVLKHDFSWLQKVNMGLLRHIRATGLQSVIKDTRVFLCNCFFQTMLVAL